MGTPLKVSNGGAGAVSAYGGGRAAVQDDSRTRTEPEVPIFARGAAPQAQPERAKPQPQPPRDVYVADTGKKKLAQTPRLTGALPSLQAPYSAKTLSTSSVHHDTTGMLAGATRQLQQGLVTLGRLPKEDVTGNYLQKTSNAVQGFQKDNNLPVTGDADWATQGAIRTQAEAKRSAQGLGPSSPRPFARSWQG